jgi:F-type H+-transporting ATPase subunit alpha
MKTVAGRLRLDLAQYRELAAFAMFAGDLDKSTQTTLARGQRMTEFLKQDQYAPVAMEKQVIGMYAGINGFLDAYAVGDVRRYERELHAHLDARHPGLLKEIAEKKELTKEITEKVKAALAEFADLFKATA